MHNGRTMTNAAADPHDALLHPADEAHLSAYARGQITSREVVRRVLERMGVAVPVGLQGDRDADAEPSLKATSEMSEDTQAFSRGELDLAGWLAKAEGRYTSR